MQKEKTELRDKLKDNMRTRLYTVCMYSLVSVCVSVSLLAFYSSGNLFKASRLRSFFITMSSPVVCLTVWTQLSSISAHTFVSLSDVTI